MRATEQVKWMSPDIYMIRILHPQIVGNKKKLRKSCRLKGTSNGTFITVQGIFLKEKK